MKESNEFIYIQKKMLEAKKQYYVHHNSIMTDFQFDMLEKQSFEIAQKLGFRANKWEDPEENEKHHIHWMIGYKAGSIYEN